MLNEVFAAAWSVCGDEETAAEVTRRVLVAGGDAALGARLAASGARNREIAERLVVSEKTVKYHLGQAYAKLAVTGRTEAVARARELGILPLDALSPA